MFDVCIIGCGVIGAAAAFELSKYQADVLILEKENDVSMGSSRANSAIIHAGYDPKPGTLMARLNVEGNAMAEQLCKDLSVPFERIGSLVLAFTEEEEATIKTLYERGVANGVPGLRSIDAEEIHAGVCGNRRQERSQTDPQRSRHRDRSASRRRIPDEDAQG